MSGACDCIRLTNEALERHGLNTELGVVYSLSGGPTTVGVETVVKEKRRGAKAARVLATHCPFCGLSYQRDTPTRTTSDERRAE